MQLDKNGKLPETYRNFPYQYTRLNFGVMLWKNNAGVFSQEVFMYEPVFEGKEYGYSYDKKTGNYLLINNEHKINLQLKKELSALFAQQIELLKNQPDDTLNQRIERTIKIHFTFSFSAEFNGFNDFMPVFVEEANINIIFRQNTLVGYSHPAIVTRSPIDQPKGSKLLSLK